MANDIVERFRKLHPKSYQMWQEDLNYLPGGVPAFWKFREPFPIYFSRAKGSRLWDIDGNEYIDTNCGNGPIILGHSHPVVLQALEEAKERGLQYGASDLVGEWARIIIKHVPAVEQIRFVNTGSEAVNYAIRLAKGYTGRKKVCKVEGCYHGSSNDWAPISISEFAGTPENPMPAPHSLGVDHTMAYTVIIPWNDTDNAVRIIKENASDLACVIMEPISGTGLGFVEPEAEYMKAIREITAAKNIPLIFDEVMVGFRWGNMGCAQSYLGITPDLCTLGKVIGGGAPAAALGGRKDIMEFVNPTHGKSAAERVYQSGTFSGNALSAAIGLATMKYLDEHEDEVYGHINKIGDKIRRGLKDIVEELKIPVQVVGGFSTYEAHFIDKPYRNAREFAQRDTKKLRLRDLELCNRGIFKLLGHFVFTNLAQTDEDVEKILTAYREAFKAVM